MGKLTDLFVRELQREKVWSRIHLVPLLLAEGDRDAYRRHRAAVAREAEIMKDVKGWEVSTDVSQLRCDDGTDELIDYDPFFPSGLQSTLHPFHAFGSQVGKSVFTNTKYPSTESIVVL
jgi:hypothetical protein